MEPEFGHTPDELGHRPRRASNAESREVARLDGMRYGRHEGADRAAANDHRGESSGQIILRRGDEMAGDAAQGKVSIAIRNPGGIVDLSGRIEKLNRQPVLSEQTVRSCREERQMEAGQSPGRPQGEAYRLETHRSRRYALAHPVARGLVSVTFAGGIVGVLLGEERE